MRNEFPPERFNEESAKKAFREVAAHFDFDIIRWALLARYAEDRKLLSLTDGHVINRGLGKVEEIEWVLEQFGEPLYGGLPLADGIPATESGSLDGLLAPESGGGYPGGFGSRPPL